MIQTPRIHTRPEHPDFLDLPWGQSIASWDIERLVDMPEGIHRHEVRFVAYRNGIYAVKELPLRLVHHEFETLRTMEEFTKHIAEPVGFVERPWLDDESEDAGALITAYVPHAFPYRDLVSGFGFGHRREAMLDALAGLLVELHLHGVYWGDCSLSNTLYRWDASSIEAVMIDAETSRIHDTLSAGQRAEDLAIMEINVAGEMADIAAERGGSLDDADLELGSAILDRYTALWRELTTSLVITAGDHYQVRKRIQRLNDLGFAVDDIDLVPVDEGLNVKMRVKVGGRQFHSEQLRQLVGVDASENQARSILSDLAYHETMHGGTSETRKAVGAMRWRSAVFEPFVLAISEALPDRDPYQGYCDFLAHRLAMATERGSDIPNEEAYEAWAAAGYPSSDTTPQPNG